MPSKKKKKEFSLTNKHFRIDGFESTRHGWITLSLSKGITEMAIDCAMKEWEGKACVKFVPRTHETDHVEFFHGKG